jgi:hypothetical protein
MPQQNALPGLVFLILFALAVLAAAPSGNGGDFATSGGIAVAGFVVAGIIANGIKVANEAEATVIFRLARLSEVRLA